MRNINVQNVTTRVPCKLSFAQTYMKRYHFNSALQFFTNLKIKDLAGLYSTQ